MTDLSKGEIKIYEQNGSNKVEVIMQDNSIWLSAEKIGELFDNKDRSTIQRHIKHIYEEDELSKDSTCAFFAQVQTEGTRNVTRNIPYYNLDVILAVGYRVSSKIATSFRKWATDILHQYVVNGYVINENLIKKEHKKLIALQTLTSSLAQSINSEKLENLDDIKKAVNFLQDFSTGLILLDDFDHGNLDKKGKTESPAQRISEEEFLEVINAMKPAFESDVFAVPKDDGFSGAVKNIYQTFGGKELYPTLEEKAAMLLYSITKDHCFHDGNKRIAASCFLYFMQKNNMLYINGKKRIDDDTLFAITLFIAESKSEDMEMFRQIIISILNRSI